MTIEINFNSNTYTVPRSVIYRGKRYLIEGHWASIKSKLQKHINYYKYTGSKYVIKSFRPDTKYKTPLLYVSYWIEE